MNERSVSEQFTSPSCEEQSHGATGGKLNPNLKFMIHYVVVVDELIDWHCQPQHQHD